MRWSNELGYNDPGMYLIVSKVDRGNHSFRMEPCNVQSGNATTNTAVVLSDRQLLSTHRSIEGRDRARGLHGDRRRQLCRSGDREAMSNVRTRHAHPLRLLVHHGFLAKDGGRYSLTQDSAVFLDKRSPAYLGGAIEFLLSPAEAWKASMRESPLSSGCSRSSPPMSITDGSPTESY
jgi:hypothetical protein